nr:hypothetical protein [Nitrosomonas nitrosa]
MRPDEVPLRHSPARSLNGRKKVVAKNGPFSLTFCQIVASMLPQCSVVAGRFDELLVAMVYTLVWKEGNPLPRGREAPHRSQRKQEVETETDWPEKDKHRE